MKKFCKLIIALCLCLGLAACGSKENQDARFNKGTYTASADGRNGEVTVTVTLSDDKIEDVQVEHQETAGIGDVAIEKLVEKTLDTQLIPSDVVSGATITSGAYLVALSEAMNASGADVKALTAEESQGTQSEEVVISDKEYDMVVVGGGAAGLMASVTGAEAGKDVLVLEKMPYFGGNMKISAGIIQAAGTSVQEHYGIMNDTVEQFMKDDLNPDAPYHAEDPVFTRTMYEGCSRMIEELLDRGMEFVNFEPVTPRYHIMTPEMYKGGNTLTELLHSQGEEAGAEYLLNARANQLVTDENGAVTGVIADVDGQLTQFNTDAVILCTGGFSSNNELVSRYYPQYAKLRSRASVGTTGDGFLMATEIGAGTRGMDTDQQMFFVSADTDTDVPLLLSFSPAILVNQKGDRFVNEDINYCLAARAAALEEGQIGYIVFGEDVRQNRPEVQGYIDNGAVVEADTLEELAEKMNTANLVATVAHYNELVASGADADFGRVFNFEECTSTGKWYGIKVEPAIYNSYGGLATDIEARVLDESGNAIQGLYAAGEVTGSTEVHEGYYYTTGNGQGLVYGQIAANTAMADNK